MLTLEFKLSLTPDKQRIIDAWLDQLRSVWNRVLGELNTWEEFSGWYSKDSKSYNPCCPIAYQPEESSLAVPYQYRYIHIKDGAIAKPQECPTSMPVMNLAEYEADPKPNCKILVPYTSLLAEQSRWYQKRMTRTCPEKEYAKAKGEKVKWIERKDYWGWKAPKDSPECNGYSCPVTTGYREPLIKKPQSQAAGGMGQVIKGENISGLLEHIIARQSEELGWQVPKIPYKYMQGLIDDLDTSWNEYLKTRYGTAAQRRGKPRFKSRHEELDTLSYTNSQNKGVRPVILDPYQVDRVRGIPGLGTLKVKGLFERWRNPDGQIPDIKKLRITRRASGYYLQLSGEVEKNLKLRNTNKAIAIDPGVRQLLTLSNGKQYPNPQFLRKTEARRQELERKLAAKMTHCLILWLNHPLRVVDDLRKVCPAISTQDAQSLLDSRPKTEKDILAHISASSMNTLKYRVLPESGAAKELKQKISRMHEKVKMQRRNNNHKVSTHLVRNFNTIVYENDQVLNMVRRSKPKENEEGTAYERNQAAAKSGLSKSLLDASIGRKKDLIKTKSKVAGRTFVEGSAKDKSKTCPICNHIQKELERYEWFRCDQCGWECDRDQNAAINLLLEVFDKGRVTLEELPPNVRKVIECRNSHRGSCQPEATSRKGRKRCRAKVLGEDREKGLAH